MKNGILTFHRTSNFGSCLQTYALYKKIADLGYDCEIVDYRCEAVENREGIGAKPSFKSLRSLLINFIQSRISFKKYNRLMEFLQREAKLSREYSRKNINEANQNYGKFIVGSDIVWGTDITNNDYTYFLDFVEENSKKFAFSSSIGDFEKYEGEEKERIAELLKDFSKISVREADAAKWIGDLVGEKIDFVCDPTMLLTAEEWDLAAHPKKAKENYVLIYFVDSDSKIFKDAVDYAKKNGLKVYFVTKALKPIKDVKIIRPSSLEEFLGLIKNANFVFTASYHGLLFSLYYHKQFLFYKRAHSGRVVSLAEYLGIEGRCGNDYDAFSCHPINYADVDKKISEFRTHSINILQEMLQK